ncbi:MAG: purine-nucleoside phosphorylase [Clostridiales bacterium]|nr:purine-nucleoside phosphorylase [Clostridiales bacterium]
MTNTPHINPLADIAETILLPGDPMRAKMISEVFLKDAVCFNRVRGALGFTGTYKGRKISVMGTGMGIPSMGIYSYELINIYGVKNLIRIGTTGAMQKEINVRDLILAQAASTNSAYMSQFGLNGSFSPTANFKLLKTAEEICCEKSLPHHVGCVLTSDNFYTDDENQISSWSKMGILATEMETAGLYANAARYGANALSILTVSDHMINKDAEITTAEEREKSFTAMIETALESAVRL